MKQLTCPDCGLVLTAHPLRKRCPECARKHAEEDRKLWKEKNAEYVKEYAKAYREAIKADETGIMLEYQQEYRREYYRKNKAYLNAQRCARRRRAKKEAAHGFENVGHTSEHS